MEELGAEGRCGNGAPVRLTVLSVSYSLGRVSERTAGGAEHILLTLDRHLTNCGHRSLVIAPGGSRSRGLLLPTPPISHQIDVFSQRRARFNHAIAIERALARFPVDVIHLHGVDFFDYLPDTAVPVVVTLHLPLSWYPPAALNLRPPWVYLVCVSRSQQDAVINTSTNTRVISNGVVVEKERLTRRKGEYVVSMGRICPEKGFHVAMDAASAAGVPLYLAGEVAGYPEHRAYFKGKILPRLGRLHRFLGPVSGERKRKLLAGARAVLVPSRVPETSSLISMEAMGSGTPVIAFRQGALEEIVTDTETGYLVTSVEEMANAILRADEIDPLRCIAEAKARFSEERMAATYLGLYQEAAEGRCTRKSALGMVA